MNYKFPLITNIEQVRKAIKDRPQFIECDKGDYIVFNYVLSGIETFPVIDLNNSLELNKELALIRELRGLVFYPNGQVASRRLHKFFNVGERLDVMSEQIDLSQPHVVLHKLDGSMITPLFINGNFRLASKMGITDVALQAENFIKDKPEYFKLFQYCLDNELTPIFEWTSRSQRIVIDYPEDNLVLIAIRHNETGEYLPYQRMSELAGVYDIPVVKALDLWHNSVEDLAEFTRQLTDQEGFVIRFDNGHMLKVKSEWYCNLHTAKSMIEDERKVIRLIVNNQLDDLKGSLQESDLARVTNLENQFVHRINLLSENLKKEILQWQHGRIDDRKNFAIHIGPNYNRYVRTLMFRAWDTHDFMEGILHLVKMNLSTGRRYNELKEGLWLKLNYDYVELDGD